MMRSSNDLENAIRSGASQRSGARSAGSDQKRSTLLEILFDFLLVLVLFLVR